MKCTRFDANLPSGEAFGNPVLGTATLEWGPFELLATLRLSDGTTVADPKVLLTADDGAPYVLEPCDDAEGFSARAVAAVAEFLAAGGGAA